MLTVDTFTLMAILLDEPEVAECSDPLAVNHPVVISAATVAEALIVAQGHYARTEIEVLIDGHGLQIAPFDPDAARRVAVSYARRDWGFHPAAPTFGNDFA